MFGFIDTMRNQPVQLTELWNLTGTHIHMNNGSVGSHSYAQVLFLFPCYKSS